MTRSRAEMLEFCSAVVDDVNAVLAGALDHNAIHLHVRADRRVDAISASKTRHLHDITDRDIGQCRLRVPGEDPGDRISRDRRVPNDGRPIRDPDRRGRIPGTKIVSSMAKSVTTSWACPTARSATFWFREKSARSMMTIEPDLP